MQPLRNIDETDLEKKFTESLEIQSSKKANEEINGILGAAQERNNFHLAARCAKELAYLNTKSDLRQRYWQQSITLAKFGASNLLGTDGLPAQAFVIETYVDFIQDPYTRLASRELISEIARTKEEISSAFEREPEAYESSQILLQRAALLRQQVRYEKGKRQKRTVAGEALRCSDRSHLLSPSAHTILSVANSSVSAARHCRNAIEAKPHLMNANSNLERIINSENLAVLLGAARLSRQLYLPRRSQDYFQKFMRLNPPTRLMLRNIDHYLEAILQSYYDTSLGGSLFSKIEAAIELAESALDFGYRSARTLINIAFLKGIIEAELSEGSTLIRLLKRKRQGSWLDFVDAVKKGLDQEIDIAFSLGIDDGIIWSRIGTYVNDIMSDPCLAHEFYKRGRDYSPNSPVARHNYAVSLSRLNDLNLIDATEDEIFHEFERAAQSSDVLFHWPDRELRRLKARKHDHLNGHKVELHSVLNEDYAYDRRPDIIPEHFEVLRDADLEGYQSSQRGLVFQRMLAAVLQNAPRVFSRNEVRRYNQVYYPGDNQPDILNKAKKTDFTFSLSGDHQMPQHWVGEVKWTKDKVSEADIAIFLQKFNTTQGAIFLSMSGFSSEALLEVKVAHQQEKKFIIPVGSADINSLMLGAIDFDVYLDFRYSYLIDGKYFVENCSEIISRKASLFGS
jgi:hypothetical protein